MHREIGRPTIPAIVLVPPDRAAVGVLAAHPAIWPALGEALRHARDRLPQAASARVTVGPVSMAFPAGEGLRQRFGSSGELRFPSPPQPGVLERARDLVVQKLRDAGFVVQID